MRLGTCVVVLGVLSLVAAGCADFPAAIYQIDEDYRAIVPHPNSVILFEQAQCI